MVISVILALHARSWNLPEFQEILIFFCRWSKKKEIKNQQEDAGMLKVLPYLISSLIKIYNFLNWVYLKNWRKTFLVTLWPLLYVSLGNLQCLASQRAKKGPLEVVTYCFCAFMIPHMSGMVFHHLLQAFDKNLRGLQCKKWLIL